MEQIITNTTTINASTFTVWRNLTEPELMRKWMAEQEMNIEVITDWTVGSVIVIKGFHHIEFQNRGRVLRFEPGRLLQYNYLSSISRLADKPENYTSIEYGLVPSGNQTVLTVTVANFPTETIFKHLNFYWLSTPGILKDAIERPR